jgi:phosphorylase kinase alpha/beta subunit
VGNLKLFFSRLPEFKSFEELEFPKHSKVKRQSSTPDAPELKQQPDIRITEWKNKSTNEILQKLNVRKMQFLHSPK